MHNHSYPWKLGVYLSFGRSSGFPPVKSLPILQKEQWRRILTDITRGITAAGTAPDSHRVPFHQNMRYPDYQIWHKCK